MKVVPQPQNDIICDDIFGSWKDVIREHVDNAILRVSFNILE